MDARTATATRPRTTGRRTTSPTRRAHRPRALVAVAGEERDPSEVHAIAEDRERGRQEREAAEDRHQDDADGADRHRGEHVDAEREQAGDGDGHGDAGEEHRATGGAAGDLDRPVLVATEAALRAEAGDDEQRIVDRDGEADEQHELAGAGGDRSHELAVDPEDAEAGQQRGEGEDERDAGGDDGAERDQQDQERQRQRQLERAVEVGQDDLVEVRGHQRRAEGVDRVVGVARPGRVETGRTASSLGVTAAASPLTAPTIRTVVPSAEMSPASAGTP